eukprot:SAG11_NODE_4024_length_2101_cov_1.093906_2_plen_62_part_00
MSRLLGVNQHAMLMGDGTYFNNTVFWTKQVRRRQPRRLPPGRRQDLFYLSWLYILPWTPMD